jgi:hypothetical protein
MPDKKIIALRHDWLFGQNALRKLRNFILFFKITPPALLSQILGNEESMTFIITWLYSKFGSQQVSSVTSLDNNNGITIIDLKEFDLVKRKIRYCLMSTGILDCHESQAFNYTEQGSSCLKALSAETYLKAYYPEPMGDFEIDEKNEELLKFFKGESVLPLAQVKIICPKFFKSEPTPEMIAALTSVKKMKKKAEGKEKRQAKKTKGEKDEGYNTLV